MIPYCFPFVLLYSIMWERVKTVPFSLPFGGGGRGMSVNFCFKRFKLYFNRKNIYEIVK